MVRQLANDSLYNYYLMLNHLQYPLFVPYMELLHEDTGKVSFDRFNSFNSHIKVAQEIRLEYHRGGELTTECLYINRNFQMYVKRKEIDTIKHSIEKRLVVEAQSYV